MPRTAEQITLLAEKRTSFDLAKMKRYFGEPFLLGDERIEDFDEYALAMASSLDPTDAAAHALQTIADREKAYDAEDSEWDGDD